MATNLTWHNTCITPEDRARHFRQQPATVWLTGLSGSGKSTLAFALEKELILGGYACYVLDGDNVRHGLSRDLGFSPEARKENIRRVAEVSRLFNDAGLIAISAFISPYREDREIARRIVGEDRFVETHLSTPISECEHRDPKGLYAKARAGKIPDFTGVSAPYEVPECAGVTLDTSILSVAESVERLVGHLRERFQLR